jgi:ATP-dependent RNA helicase DeaD
LGSVDDFTRGDMLGYICNQSKISGKSIGKIDLKGVYTFFEVENDVVEKVQQGFKSVDFQGRNVRIELAGDRDGGGGGRSGGGGYKGGSGGGKRREGSGGGRRDGGNRGGGGFRDFSGKRREERSERRKKW